MNVQSKICLNKSFVCQNSGMDSLEIMQNIIDYCDFVLSKLR